MPNEVTSLPVPQAEIDQLRRRLAAAEAALAADSPYRVMVQSLNEGALTLSADGVIAYSNPCFAAMVQLPANELVGVAFPALLMPSERPAFEAVWRQMSQAPARAEFHLRRPDGSQLAAQLSGQPLGPSQVAAQLSGQPLGAPQVAAVIIVAIDLSERLRAEAQALFQSQLLAAVGQAIIAIDQEGRISYWNREAEALYGWPADEVIGRSALEVVVNQASHAQGREIMAALTAGGKWSGEFEVQRRDGSTFPAYVTDSPVLDSAGRLIGVIGASFDISERKQAEAALHESDERFRLAMTAANMAVFNQDRDLRYTWMYQPHRWYTGGPVIGRTDAELVPGSVMDRTMQIKRGVIESGVGAHEEVSVTFGAVTTHFDLLLEPLRDGAGAVTGLVGAARDITARKQAEEAVRASEKSYRELFENSITGIVQVHPDGRRLLRVNPAFARMYGYDSPQQMIAEVTDVGRQIYSDPLAREGVRQNFGAVDVSVPREVEVVRRDGSHFFVLVAVQRVQDASGNVLFYQSTHSDVTAHKQAEVALRASEKNYRELFENSTVGISQAHLDGTRLLRVNPAFARMYGYDSPQQMIAEVTDIARQIYAQPEEREAVIAHLLRHGELAPRETQVRRRDGTTFYVLMGAQVVVDAGGKPLYYQATHSDVTARKQAELEVQHRLAELEALQRISSALRTAKTAEEMLPLLLDEALAVLGTEAGGIWMFDPTHAKLQTTLARGWYQQLAALPRSSLRGDIAARVLEQRQPYVSREFASDPLTGEALRAHIPAGWGGAVVPILAGQQVIGLMQVGVALPRELLPNEVHLLTTLSEIAGSAIQRSGLHEDTERHLQQLAALSEIDRAIGSSFDVQVILNVLLDKTITDLGVDAADVLLLDTRAGKLRFGAGKGFRGSDIQASELRLGVGYASRAALEGSLIHVANLEKENTSPRLAKVLAREAFVTYHGVPLSAKGKVQGVLEVFQRAPFEPNEDWLGFLNALAGQAAIAIDNTTLFRELQRSNTDLTLAYDDTIEGWSRALDLRDKETEGHSLRVTELSVQLCRALGLGDADLAQVRWGALLHDIGKMGIPDRILLKPGPLTDDEWVLMKQHPVLAYQMLAPISYLHAALDIPYCHHEKWDGSGYPRGLAGEQIPLAARAFAVVDVWDALTSARPYRPAWPAAETLSHILALAGTHFDPRVVSAAGASGLLKAPPPA